MIQKRLTVLLHASYIQDIFHLHILWYEYWQSGNGDRYKAVHL